MSLQDKMTSLATNTRKVSWQTGKLGLDNMNSLLSNLLVFNSTMPYIIMNGGNHHGPSKYQEGYQVFNFGSATNFGTNFYAQNWELLQFNIDTSTVAAQSFTITTDGTVTEVKPHMYISGLGDCENVISSYYSKVADNTYRVYLKASTNNYGPLEPFNFNMSATNCNYLKFSEPYLGIMGGIVNLLLTFGNCSSLIKEV